jgi:hypothetical protein
MEEKREEDREIQSFEELELFIRGKKGASCKKRGTPFTLFVGGEVVLKCTTWPSKKEEAQCLQCYVERALAGGQVWARKMHEYIL